MPGSEQSRRAGPRSHCQTDSERTSDLIVGYLSLGRILSANVGAPKNHRIEGSAVREH